MRNVSEPKVPEAAESKVIADFKARTEELFNPVNGQTTGRYRNECLRLFTVQN